MKTKLAISATIGAVIMALINYTFTPTQNMTKLSVDTSNGSVTQNGDSWDVSVVSDGYARINYKVPEQDAKYLTTFDMAVNFTLPPTFYSDMRNGFRILTTDNFKTTLNGTTVGAKDANEWRCGVYYYASDGLVYIKCEHETLGTLLLWKSPGKMTTGTHTIRFYGDMGQASPWGVVIDGVTVASGTKRLCLTSELLDSECVVTRVRAGIDGGGAGAKLTINSFSVAELPNLSTVTPASNMTITISTNTPVSPTATLRNTPTVSATVQNLPSLTPTASRTPVLTVTQTNAPTAPAGSKITVNGTVIPCPCNIIVP